MDDATVEPDRPLRDPARRGFVVVDSPQQHRQIAIVVGMDASGTSVCAHILRTLGIDMTARAPRPEPPLSGPRQAQHLCEHGEIAECHDRLLGLFGRQSASSFVDLPLPLAWWTDPRVAPLRRELIDLVGQRMVGGIFGFEDGRTASLMPVWRYIFNHLKLTPKIVLCLRDPADVAHSLKASDGLDQELAEFRWFSYMLNFFQQTGAFEVCPIEYETWFDDPIVNLKKLRTFFGLQPLEWQDDLEICDLIMQQMSTDDRRQQRRAMNPLVRSLYEFARSDNPGSRDPLNSFVSQFTALQRLQRPLQRALENEAIRAAQAIEREGQAAKSEIAGLRDALSQAQREAREHAGLAEAAREEADRLRHALAQTDRDAQKHAAAAEAMHREIAELSDAQARAVQQRAAMTRAAQEKIAELRTALAESVRDVQERGITAEATQAEINRLHEALGGLRETLAQTGREMQVRDVAADATKAEIYGLRTALAQAEREARELHEASGRLREALARAESEAELVARRDAASLAEAREQLDELRSKVSALESEVALYNVAIVEMASSFGRWRRVRSTYTFCGDRARDAGRWALAARFYRKALGRNPNDPPIWVQYGHALKEAGRFAEAENAYRKAICYAPDVADYHLQLGHALKLQQRTDEAAASYLRASALDPTLCAVAVELEAFG